VIHRRAQLHRVRVCILVLLDRLAILTGMKVTVDAAEAMLSKLIERAHAGEEIVIARGDVPVARIVPIEAARPARRQPETLRGLVKIDDAFFDPLPEAELALWETEDR
jgi:antitoxin (DNA-binding transcriptional repressor) of toxin-antitoxin stability system